MARFWVWNPITATSIKGRYFALVEGEVVDLGRHIRVKPDDAVENKEGDMQQIIPILNAVPKGTTATWVSPWAIQAIPGMEAPPIPEHYRGMGIRCTNCGYPPSNWQRGSTKGECSNCGGAEFSARPAWETMWDLRNLVAFHPQLEELIKVLNRL